MQKVITNKTNIMGFFDFLKKDNKSDTANQKNEIEGPTCLEGLTIETENLKNLQRNQWSGKLKTQSGQTTFKIKYYGDRQGSLVVRTEFAPAKLFAVDEITGQEILLFDGCIHGYDPIFSDTYSAEQLNDRKVNHFYVDEDSNNIFEIELLVHYNLAFQAELLESVDENGFVELDNGSKIEFEKAKRNGFDVLQIFVKNKNGKITAIVSEELA
jgi:hypothetical protein